MDGNYSYKTDPLEYPKFDSDLKLCTKTEEHPKGLKKSDGFPVLVTNLVFCNMTE